MVNITLYTAPTGNGRKIAIMLEELGIEYNYKPVNILTGGQYQEDYIKINPNSKIPTLIDHSENDFPIFESGAILIYLAEKYGKLLPADKFKRSEVIQWLFFQNAGVGPMFGQFGHFYKYGGKDMEDKYPLERYTKETKRLLKVLDNRLAKSRYLGGDEFTIADISTFPWVAVLDEYFQAQEILELNCYLNLQHWHKECMSRESVQKAYQRLSLAN
jgi:GSH-dependent disulfide-bond oxidoreductase